VRSAILRLNDWKGIASNIFGIDARLLTKSIPAFQNNTSRTQNSNLWLADRRENTVPGYQLLISSVRGPNNYFLYGPTIRRGVQYFSDNSAKKNSSAESNHYRPLSSENNIRPFRRRRKPFSKKFGRPNTYLFFDEIKRW
jgi:hypothetical protein